MSLSPWLKSNKGYFLRCYTLFSTVSSFIFYLQCFHVLLAAACVIDLLTAYASLPAFLKLYFPMYCSFFDSSWNFQVWSLSSGTLLRNIVFPSVIDAIALNPVDMSFLLAVEMAKYSLLHLTLKTSPVIIMGCISLIHSLIVGYLFLLLVPML